MREHPTPLKRQNEQSHLVSKSPQTEIENLKVSHNSHSTRVFKLIGGKLVDIGVSEPIIPKRVGGQSCGMPNVGWVVRSELGIEIRVDTYRSMFKNRDLALELLDLAIDEIVPI